MGHKPSRVPPLKVVTAGVLCGEDVQWGSSTCHSKLEKGRNI